MMDQKRRLKPAATHYSYSLEERKQEVNGFKRFTIPLMQNSPE
jgi:hypothetical protein